MALNGNSNAEDNLDVEDNSDVEDSSDFEGNPNVEDKSNLADKSDINDKASSKTPGATARDDLQWKVLLWLWNHCKEYFAARIIHSIKSHFERLIEHAMAEQRVANQSIAVEVHTVLISLTRVIYVLI